MIKIGASLPSIKVKHLTPQGIEDIALDQFCQNKKVVVFGVPGAFTPTCSGKHAPSFLKVADQLKSKGVDNIICLSVNDPFVMDAWGKCMNTNDKILMVADHAGNATKSLGLEIDMSAPGLGLRSKRYSMLVENNIVKKLFVEDEASACDISSGDHILNAI
jgi:glutaredoxin/glutathione-dependent peroxiredoxin